MSEQAEVSGNDLGTVTRIVGGHFAFDSRNTDLLAAFLSPIVHFRATEDGAGRLGRVLAMIDDEVSSGRPGRDSMLARLLEIVLIEWLRAAPDGSDDRRKGMLAGLVDPMIASAVRAFHSDICRTWTVGALAARASMSRSAFPQRFSGQSCRAVEHARSLPGIADRICPRQVVPWPHGHRLEPAAPRSARLALAPQAVDSRPLVGQQAAPGRAAGRYLGRCMRTMRRHEIPEEHCDYLDTPSSPNRQDLLRRASRDRPPDLPTSTTGPSAGRSGSTTTAHPPSTTASARSAARGCSAVSLPPSPA